MRAFYRLLLFGLVLFIQCHFSECIWSYLSVTNKGKIKENLSSTFEMKNEAVGKKLLISIRVLLRLSSFTYLRAKEILI